MSKNIKLSKKHGLNPTIPICFFCGEQKNEVALLGKLPNDTEAPMYMILDYEPCDECKKKMENGITLIGVTNHENTKNQLPISMQNGIAFYPTGKFVVIKPDAVHKVFKDDIVDKILEMKKCFVDDSVILDLTSNLKD